MEIQKYDLQTDRQTWVGARDACASKNMKVKTINLQKGTQKVKMKTDCQAIQHANFCFIRYPGQVNISQCNKVGISFTFLLR